MAARIDISMPVGNEGAGVVTEAGNSAAAQALMGKTVAVLGGAMYAQYRCVKINQCLVLPAGATAADGASCFVNPLTALGMIGTMQREGHKALVHTAAASNLGQMLNRLCLKDRHRLGEYRPQEGTGRTIEGGRRSPRLPHGLADVSARI